MSVPSSEPVRSPQSRTQSRTLARTIRQRIQAERLPDGAFFTTEARLAAEYGVSRTVIREAVGRLQAFGILEARKRKGLIVRRPDPIRLLEASLPSLATSPEHLRDLVKFREALECGAIELAIREGTDEQIAALVEIEQELEEAVRADMCSSRAVELDVRFHALILEMTGSALIAGMRRILAPYFKASPGADPTPATAQRICWEHRELLAAIRDRDVERARTMVRLHMRSVHAAVDRMETLPAFVEEES